jgi:hypothetical protein
MKCQSDGCAAADMPWSTMPASFAESAHSCRLPEQLDHSTVRLGNLRTELSPARSAIIEIIIAQAVATLYAAWLPRGLAAVGNQIDALSRTTRLAKSSAAIAK